MTYVLVTGALQTVRTALNGRICDQDLEFGAKMGITPKKERKRSKKRFS